MASPIDCAGAASSADHAPSPSNAPARSWLGRNISKVADGLFPRCPVSGNRCWIPIPHIVDRLLGGANFALYKLSAPRSVKQLELGIGPSAERVSSDTETQRVLESQRQISAAQTVNEIFERLKPQVPSWPVSVWDLNPWADNHREWELLVEYNGSCNAFALPGGKVVVFDGILQQIWDRIKAKQLAVGAGRTWQITTQVKNADGQHENLTLDLSGVRYEDVVAALVGHEMTHVAARHGILRLLIQVLLNLVLNLVLKILEVAERKNAYLDGKKIALSHVMRALIRMLDACSDLIFNMLTLCLSRSNEYEADRHGMKIAQDANYNPLGALALQELFGEMQPSENSLMRFLEKFRTHPLASNRLKALAQELQDNQAFRQVLTAAIPRAGAA